MNTETANKMTLRRFNEIKEKMRTVYLRSQYNALINELQNSDLSNIPFEAWDDAKLIYADNLRFQNTHANIDFNYFHYDGDGNFKGCVVKNIEKKRGNINPAMFDQKTINENPNLFLINANIPENIKNKCFSGDLTYQDILLYPDAFTNTPINIFMRDGAENRISEFFVEKFGASSYIEIIKKHYDVFELLRYWREFGDFYGWIEEKDDYEKTFIEAFNKYASHNSGYMDTIRSYVHSININYIDEITYFDELKNNNDLDCLIIGNKRQRRILDILNKKNIIDFNNKTNFFEGDGALNVFFDTALFSFDSFYQNYEYDLLNKGINFKEENLSYDDFEKQFTLFLNEMRLKDCFANINTDLLSDDYIKKYPYLFIDKDAPQELKKAFYSNCINIEFITKNPQYDKYFEKMDLSRDIYNLKMKINLDYRFQQNFSDVFTPRFGNSKFISLIRKYNDYLRDLLVNVSTSEIEDEEKIEKAIRQAIYERIKENKKQGYSYFYANLENIPEMVSEYPDLFLKKDAPQELKDLFYHCELNIEDIQEHNNWISYFTKKQIVDNFLGDVNNFDYFFKKFGDQNAKNLLIKKFGTVIHMLKNNKVDIMYEWWEKTGHKFIPDYVIMDNIDIKDADKFFTSTSNWGQLMKLNLYNDESARKGMLKLAYAFGVFDQDQKGTKLLIDLLGKLPKKIDSSGDYDINDISYNIERYSDRDYYFSRYSYDEAFSKMITHIKERDKFSNNGLDNELLVQLLEALKTEDTGIDFKKNIMSQIYEKDNVGNYILKINDQNCPKASRLLRKVMNSYYDIPILNNNYLGSYFENLDLKYEPDFRDFMLANIDDILTGTDDEYSEYLEDMAELHREFQKIKATYSNVYLTLDLAISYLNSSKYEEVEVGNEKVTAVAALQGYDQDDFEKLQEIYNVGKQRVFSSIPRVESKDGIELKTGKYYYELLRLDDPRAMSVGFESDCCQALDHAAESCMEHSMVSKNGRVFIITNEKNELVAQSWVWRNKNVLCFDNIEIPDKKMRANGVARGEEDSGIKNQFTDDILSIYKQAAKKILKEDERVYKKLLTSGKISQDQYDASILSKITTGLGYSNLSGSLKDLPEEYQNRHPLGFRSPVIEDSLYISDSYNTQYILEEREDNVNKNNEDYSANGKYIETLPVHSDTYIEYTDSNFTPELFTAFNRLNLATNNQYNRIEDSITNEPISNNPVSELAKKYNLNPETTKIIMHPNFSIVYDVNDNVVRIGDLLFNTKFDYYDDIIDEDDDSYDDDEDEEEENYNNSEKIVLLQIKLALLQIGKGKRIDSSLLSGKKLNMFNKAKNIKKELDIERGVGRGR